MFPLLQNFQKERRKKEKLNFTDLIFAVCVEVDANNDKEVDVDTRLAQTVAGWQAACEDRQNF